MTARYSIPIIGVIAVTLVLAVLLDGGSGVDRTAVGNGSPRTGLSKEAGDAEEIGGRSFLPARGPQAVRIRFRPVDAVTGDPVRGVDVLGGVLRVTYADDLEMVRIQRRRLEEQCVTLRAAGYVDHELSLPSMDSDLGLVELRPSDNLRIRVSGPDGESAPGAHVFVALANGRELRVGSTDSEGAWSGNLRLPCVVYARLGTTVSLMELADRAELRLRLLEGARLHVVRDAESATKWMTRATVSPLVPDLKPMQVEFDERGFSNEWVAPGRYELVVSEGGVHRRISAVGDRKAKPNEWIQVVNLQSGLNSIRLESPEAPSVRIISAESGRAIREASVRVYGFSKGNRITLASWHRKSDSGRYVLLPAHASDAIRTASEISVAAPGFELTTVRLNSRDSDLVVRLATAPRRGSRRIRFSSTLASQLEHVSVTDRWGNSVASTSWHEVGDSIAFQWPGGDIKVLVNREIEYRVLASWLDDGSDVVVPLDKLAGAIRVRFGRSRVALECVTPKSRLKAIHEDGGLLIPCVAPGEVSLVIAGTADSALPGHAHLSSVRVSAGRATTVDVEVPSFEPHLRGRIDVRAPRAVRLYVAPAWGQYPLAYVDTHLSSRLREDGSFLIKDVPCPPTHLVVFDWDADRLRPVVLCVKRWKRNGDYALELCDCAVKVRGAGRELVELRLAPSSMFQKVRFFEERTERRRSNGSLIFRSVPCGDVTLSRVVHGRRQTWKGVVSRGQANVIVVDLRRR